MEQLPLIIVEYPVMSLVVHYTEVALRIICLSMALEIKLNQKLSQSLVMTPQLQQAIKLLQLGRGEYLEVIAKEVMENPILEEVSEGEEQGSLSRKAATTEVAEKVAEDTFWREQEEKSRELLNNDGGAVAETQFEYASRSSNFRDDKEGNSIEATLGNPTGLSSHLLWQLRTLELSEQDKTIAVHIVGNLDKNGYLCSSLEELSQDAESEVEEIERVLGVVQTLDPVGIAARDLRECLLIQLDQLGLNESLSWKIVDKYLPDLESRRYDSVAKALGVGLEAIKESIRLIQKLEPRPGRPFVDEAPVFITPDVYVKKIGEEFVVSLNEAGIPKLRLNSYYQDLLSKSALIAEQGAQGDKEYLQEKLRSASWLIKSIEQRQQTILKVTESIVKFQRDFLEQGVSGLKPLVLKDVALAVGIHESTVSRVTTNKYVHTPQGVFELKYFFTSGLRSDAGDVSSEAVKGRIRELIARENQKKPLSDQDLVKALKEEGIDIARRTVAKYREMMNILSSSQRKQVL